MLASIALLARAAACGDDATGPRSGSLAVAVSGLPAGVDADQAASPQFSSLKTSADE